ncbi:MAG TPA: hypothetical protein VGM07_16335 [Stellaceae bacterium]|jgi:hypothetical protein
MRRLPVLVLTTLLVAGCTPYIPVKDAFGVSAQQPVGTIPPEFAEFNNYNPQAALLLATQICATPYELHVEKSLDAAPGQIVSAAGRCQTYPGPLATLRRTAPPGPGSAP